MEKNGDIIIIPYFWHIPKSGGSTMKQLLRLSYFDSVPIPLSTKEEVEYAYEQYKSIITELPEYLVSNYLYETEAILKLINHNICLKIYEKDVNFVCLL